MIQLNKVINKITLLSFAFLFIVFNNGCTSYKAQLNDKREIGDLVYGKPRSYFANSNFYKITRGVSIAGFGGWAFTFGNNQLTPIQIMVRGLIFVGGSGIIMNTGSVYTSIERKARKKKLKKKETLKYWISGYNRNSSNKEQIIEPLCFLNSDIHNYGIVFKSTAKPLQGNSIYPADLASINTETDLIYRFPPAANFEMFTFKEIAKEGILSGKKSLAMLRTGNPQGNNQAIQVDGLLFDENFEKTFVCGNGIFRGTILENQINGWGEIRNSNQYIKGYFSNNNLLIDKNLYPDLLNAFYNFSNALTIMPKERNNIQIHFVKNLVFDKDPFDSTIYNGFNAKGIISLLDEYNKYSQIDFNYNSSDFYTGDGIFQFSSTFKAVNASIDTLQSYYTLEDTSARAKAIFSLNNDLENYKKANNKSQEPGIFGLVIDAFNVIENMNPKNWNDNYIHDHCIVKIANSRQFMETCTEGRQMYGEFDIKTNDYDYYIYNRESRSKPWYMVKRFTIKVEDENCYGLLPNDQHSYKIQGNGYFNSFNEANDFIMKYIDQNYPANETDTTQEYFDKSLIEKKISLRSIPSQKKDSLIKKYLYGERFSSNMSNSITGVWLSKDRNYLLLLSGAQSSGHLIDLNKIDFSREISNNVLSNSSQSVQLGSSGIASLFGKSGFPATSKLTLNEDDSLDFEGYPKFNRVVK
jgi:hypothetical protein